MQVCSRRRLAFFFAIVAVFVVVVAAPLMSRCEQRFPCRRVERINKTNCVATESTWQRPSLCVADDFISVLAGESDGVGGRGGGGRWGGEGEEGREKWAFYPLPPSSAPFFLLGDLSVRWRR